MINDPVHARLEIFKGVVREFGDRLNSSCQFLGWTDFSAIPGILEGIR